MSKLFCNFILLSLIFSYSSLQAQDSIPLKKWQTKKFEIGMTVSAFFPPPVYGEGIIDHKSKLSFGGDLFVNYHFTKHLGITWGLGISVYKKSFEFVDDYVHNNPDTVYFSFKPKAVFLRAPVNFLWDINPKGKVKCFVNTGLAPLWHQTDGFIDGDNPGIYPSSLTYGFKLNCSYNFNFGIKVALYKSLTYIAFLSYEDTFIPVLTHAYSVSIAYTKSRFLSLHMGLCL